MAGAAQLARLDKRLEAQEERPLRVAAFTTSYPSGPGDIAGRFVFNTVRQLRAHGVDVEVVGPDAYDDFGLTGSRSGGVVAALRRRPWLAPLLVVSMIRALRRAAKNADLVHANWLAGAFVARFARTPFVVTLHGSGTAGRFSDLALAARAPWLVRLLLGRARAVICCSETLASAMRGCGLQNVHAIPYGVELPDASTSEDEPPTVLYAGRLSPEKNIDVIAAATDGLPRVIVGEGPLRELVPDAVDFVPQEELGEYYRRAAVVVLASSREGLPNVVLEAMAHGKTVVATPVGGIPTLIEDGVNGILVPVGDAAALRSALERVLADRVLRARLGRAARRRVEELCSWPRVTQRTIAVYRAALPHPAAEPRQRMTYEQFRATRFFPALEGLRAVAALLVVFHHARSHWLWGWLEGWNGVTLFFVLSGFLITTLALREEDALGALRWRAFVVRRAFRIVPVYLAALALYVVAMAVAGIGAAHRGPFVHAMPWYLSPFPEVPFFSRTHIVFSLAWSLGVEEKFYLLWPLLAFVVLRGRARGRLGLALSLAFVLQLPIAFSHGGRLLAPYSAILVGCVLAFLLHDRRGFAALSRLGTRAWFLASAALLVGAQALTHVLHPTAAGFRVASPYYYLPYSAAAALVVAALVLRAPGSSWLESAPMRLVGRVSYPLYLTHPLALAFAAALIAPGNVTAELAYLAVGITLAVALAYALHRLVERPLIRVGRRQAERVETRRRPVAKPQPATS